MSTTSALTWYDRIPIALAGPLCSWCLVSLLEPIPLLFILRELPNDDKKFSVLINFRCGLEKKRSKMGIHNPTLNTSDNANNSSELLSSVFTGCHHLSLSQDGRNVDVSDCPVPGSAPGFSVRLSDVHPSLLHGPYECVQLWE